MDLEKLLRRVKAEDSERNATLDTLRKLCMGFMANIPFENTDMCRGKTKIWNLEIIYENIVDKNRGGFCNDLNGLLQWVLKQFGFKVVLLKAYNVKPDGQFYETSDHMTLMVTLSNGDKYLTDVGFGGWSISLPLKMKFGVPQSQQSGVYRLGRKDGLITVEKKKQRYLKTEEDVIEFDNDEEDPQWKVQFGFTEASGYNLGDFQEGYDYAQFKNGNLVGNMFVALQNEKGRKFFVNNLFYEKEYVNPETIKLKRYKKCTVDEMYWILENEFNLKLDFELKLKNIVE